MQDMRFLYHEVQRSVFVDAALSRLCQSPFKAGRSAVQIRHISDCNSLHVGPRHSTAFCLRNKQKKVDGCQALCEATYIKLNKGRVPNKERNTFNKFLNNDNYRSKEKAETKASHAEPSKISTKIS